MCVRADTFARHRFGAKHPSPNGSRLNSACSEAGGEGKNKVMVPWLQRERGAFLADFAKKAVQDLIKRHYDDTPAFRRRAQANPRLPERPLE